MILRVIKWLLITLGALLVGFVLVLAIGSRTSLDFDYQYTANASALPPLTADAAPGLVRISANGYEFRARVAGFEFADQRPAVILLHGFPVNSAMWTPIIEPLTAAGFRVLAFDQRGYSPGARPVGEANYQVSELSDDVIAVADAAGLASFHLIGHDWGAVVGWATVMRFPERILSWTGLSIAHPAAFSAALQNDPVQQSRSSYFMLFQTPYLPEALFSFNDFTLLRGAYSNMTAAQATEYLQMFAEPGALTSALNWYRAMSLGQQGGGSMDIPVSVPTLFIWGNEDQAVARSGVEGQAKYMQGPYEEIELDAGHWLLEDYPLEIGDAIVEHLLNWSPQLEP